MSNPEERFNRYVVRKDSTGWYAIYEEYRNVKTGEITYGSEPEYEGSYTIEGFKHNIMCLVRTINEYSEPEASGDE